MSLHDGEAQEMHCDLIGCFLVHCFVTLTGGALALNLEVEMAKILAQEIVFRP